MGDGWAVAAGMRPLTERLLGLFHSPNGCSLAACIGLALASQAPQFKACHAPQPKWEGKEEEKEEKM